MDRNDKISLILRDISKQSTWSSSYIFYGASFVVLERYALNFICSGRCISQSDTPCFTCVACKAVLEYASCDFIFLKDTFIGVDKIRELLADISTGPIEYACFFVLIDVRFLGKGSAQALLKSLEDSPPKVCFIFLTESVYALPLTIRSRSQTFYIEDEISSKTKDSNLEKIPSFVQTMEMSLYERLVLIEGIVPLGKETVLDMLYAWLQELWEKEDLALVLFKNMQKIIEKILMFHYNVNLRLQMVDLLLETTFSKE